ncbi:DUF3806 domain-containing protein [Aestuariicella hydrocarbonica]|uniref:DUF3806 domain-containing protein n=1 Tax=Pseudomaricurvus hydrocarbonicus TaxID=1470433 RepID=A0A9E5MKI0_9GAMM|nr:DUF3806 domain-containing protein [Aestuariicella hydrocarbonica]NHO65407.1 DUF3806 domain-containing protein [Aestuariicella hydrocarbonica]
MKFFACFLITALLSPGFALAQSVAISDLNWLQRNNHEKQVQQIDELARINLGMQVNGTKADLQLLQRIIYRGLIAKDDHLAQQALGAVLGDVMVNEMGLEWKIYEDKLGFSRAACAPGTQECLFPITMLSRRMAVGILPNVEELYQETHEMIAPLLPKNPYDVIE